MCRSYKFTLLELLTVIAVLGVLAGIMVPVMQRVRMSGRKTSCLNNLRQIGIAVTNYVSSYNDRLPVCARIPSSPDDCLSVANMVVIDDGKVYKCPSDSNRAYEGRTFYGRYGTSYEWNTWLNGRLIDRSTLNLGGLLINTPLMGDAVNFHGQLGRNYLYADGHVRDSLDELIK